MSDEGDPKKPKHVPDSDEEDNQSKHLKKHKDEKNYEDSDDSDDEVMCTKCGNSLCELINWMPPLSEEATRIICHKSYKEKGNNLKRKRMYKFYTELVYGELGQNVRVPISPCIMDYIRSLFPSHDGNYMGFKEK